MKKTFWLEFSLNIPDLCFAQKFFFAQIFLCFALFYFKVYPNFSCVNNLKDSVLCSLLSHVRLFVTPWIAAHQTPLSMEFSRQDYENGLPFPSPGNLPNPGTERGSPALQADSLLFEPPGVGCSLPDSSVHGIFSGKNTGVGCHALFQGIVQTQELNPPLLCLLHCRQILYPLSYGEAPRFCYLSPEQMLSVTTEFGKSAMYPW